MPSPSFVDSTDGFHLLTLLLPADFAFLLFNFVACVAGWGENYDREWDMLTNCGSMAIEEERIIKVKVAKLERHLDILRLEV